MLIDNFMGINLLEVPILRHPIYIIISDSDYAGRSNLQSAHYCHNFSDKLSIELYVFAKPHVKLSLLLNFCRLSLLQHFRIIIIFLQIVNLLLRSLTI